MTKKEFLMKLEEVIEAEAGIITGEEALKDLDGWDSIAVMSFIAMVDENFGMTIPASNIAKAVSVNDLVSLLGDKITN